MANMSYCRFENTSRDLEDCLDYFDEHYTLDELSKSERRFAEKMYELCITYAKVFEDIREEDYDE